MGFYLWAGHVTQLSFSAQQWDIILAGAGIGFMLGPASTDAVNRASRLSYGEATGITQTVRNYAASLGLAVLGTILVSQFRSRVTTSLVAAGPVPCTGLGRGGGRRRNRRAAARASVASPISSELDFAYATRSVFYVMAAIMAAAAVVAFVGLQRGLQEEQEETGGDPAVEVSTSTVGHRREPVAHDLHHALKGGVVEPAVPSRLAGADDQADHLVGRDVGADSAAVHRPSAQLVDVALHLVHHLEALRLDVDPGRPQGFEQIPLG